MRQIPKRLLPDTAIVRLPDDDASAGGHFEQERTIERVRYDKSASIRRTDYQLQDGTTGIVYIDAVNSVGAFEVPAGSVLKIGSVEVYVNITRTFEGFAGHVHHWELEVQ